LVIVRRELRSGSQGTRNRRGNGRYGLIDFGKVLLWWGRRRFAQVIERKRTLLFGRRFVEISEGECAVAHVVVSPSWCQKERGRPALI
jgi:hypothetical protein